MLSQLKWVYYKICTLAYPSENVFDFCDNSRGSVYIVNQNRGDENQ